MQPDQFLVVAQRLLDDPEGGESCLRSAAHAAYYAVYHLIAAHFGMDPTNKGEARHIDVMAALDKGNSAGMPRHVREAKRFYRSLWALRTKADYKLDLVFSPVDAERSFEYARAIFGALSSQKNDN